MSSVAASARAPYLVSRTLDFWLLGGASLLAYAIMVSAAGFRDLYGVSNQFGNLAVTMSMMSLLVNYPHFLASYRLAYGRSKGFLLKHWFATVLVPCLMINFLVAAYWFANDPDSKGICEKMLGVGINFMYFTVGWHYSKQAFGCMMVYAAYDRYPLDRVQRESIRYSLLSVWWYNFAYSNLAPTGSFWSLTYQTWQVPFNFYYASRAVFGLGALWVAYRVLFKNWRAGHRPGPTLWVPYVAMAVWFAPCFRQPDFFFYVVPFFHSLQYLAFVYRVERSRPALRESAVRATLLVLGLCFSGWMAFELVPGNLDKLFDNLRTFGFSFFLIAANLFINIHHYFLDNVLWRVRDDETVRQALFSSSGEAE
jgi:hypothetical protein